MTMRHCHDGDDFVRQTTKTQKHSSETPQGRTMMPMPKIRGTASVGCCELSAWQRGRVKVSVSDEMRPKKEKGKEGERTSSVGSILTQKRSFLTRFVQAVSYVQPLLVPIAWAQSRLRSSQEASPPFLLVRPWWNDCYPKSSTWKRRRRSLETAAKADGPRRRVGKKKKTWWIW